MCLINTQRIFFLLTSHFVPWSVCSGWLLVLYKKTREQEKEEELKEKSNQRVIYFISFIQYSFNSYSCFAFFLRALGQDSSSAEEMDMRACVQSLNERGSEYCTGHFSMFQIYLSYIHLLMFALPLALPLPLRFPGRHSTPPPPPTCIAFQFLLSLFACLHIYISPTFLTVPSSCCSSRQHTFILPPLLHTLITYHKWPPFHVSSPTHSP